MDTHILDEYPGLRELFENLLSKQQEKFFGILRGDDAQYAELIKNRANQSMVLRNRIKDSAPQFEKYSDSIYAQELYEFDKVYTQAFCDAVAALKSLGLL